MSARSSMDAVDAPPRERTPRTFSGEVLEVPVKRILMGAPLHEVAARGTLTNPAGLEYFVLLVAAR